MIKRLNKHYYMMMTLATFLILLGLGVGVLYHKGFFILSAIGLLNIILVSKKRADFMKEYAAYNCEAEADSVIPDKFIKFLHYGKNNLYYTAVHGCNIIAYEGLEVEKITGTFAHLANKNYFKVYKDRYKKMKLDISQIQMDDFQNYLFKNIEEAQKIDIEDVEFQNVIKEREATQQALLPTKMLPLLCIDTFGILIPTLIVYEMFSEKIAVFVLMILVVIATIITIPISIKYIKSLFQYKAQLKNENATIPGFYRIYLRFAFLPILIILFMWFLAILMGADILFNFSIVAHFS